MQIRTIKYYRGKNKTEYVYEQNEMNCCKT